MTNLIIEKYRPRTIAECVLSSSVQSLLQRVVDDEGPPQNMLFHGGPGIGKTTALRALARQKELDLFFINMSVRGNIDTLRTEIQQFASSVSLTGNGKLVGGDEFDYSNQQSTQPALRGMIEEFQENCRFVFTCNYPRRIIEPLLSRLVSVDFSIPAEEKERVAGDFMRRVRYILDEEGIEYDRGALAGLIIDRFPNFRKILNDCQRTYNEVGRIDQSVGRIGIDKSFQELIGHMRAKKFREVRGWVARNSDLDPATIFRRFYDQANELFDKRYVPQLVLTLADYQHKAALVMDQEINTSACFAEVMADAEWL